MTRRELEELHERVIESARSMTVEEFKAWSRTSGIWTETGEMTEQYGGPNRENQTKEDPPNAVP